MGKPISVRLDDLIEEKVERYLAKNPGIKLPRLVNLAVEQFISQTHTIELVPVSDEEVGTLTKSILQKHRKSMDELK